MRLCNFIKMILSSGLIKENYLKYYKIMKNQQTGLKKIIINIHIFYITLLF